MELQVKGLKVNAFDKQILKGIDLNIKSGEIHAIMGPNGAGKSSLVSSIMGDPKLKVSEGQILLDNIELTEFEVDKRAKLGIFLAMQQPVEIPGVTNLGFIKAAVSNIKNEKISITSFLKELDYNIGYLKMKKDLPHRYLNDGFSGGEKKRNEILQMLMLKPRFVMLDEIDSGLDIDGLKIVGSALKEYHTKDNAMLVITHYQRVLEFIKPDFVHIMIGGKIVKTGGIELIAEIEEKGYKNWEGKNNEI